MNCDLYEHLMNAAQKEYDKEYSTGDYCHEQSFLWGFQEGAEWMLNKLEELKRNEIHK